MKTINETFTDDEYEALKERKGSKSWHDFILSLCDESTRKNKEKPK